MTTVDMSWSRVAVGIGAYRAVAVAAGADGSWQPVPFDGRPWLSAGVYRSGDGPVLTGVRAQQAAATDPSGYVPDPVRRISADAIPLGDRPIPGVRLVAAVLRRVLEETQHLYGRRLPEVVVVIPPGWGPPRRALLRQATQDAARQVGIEEPDLIPAAEAVAARGEGIDVPVARWVVVCDLGTRATVTVISRGAAGYEILAELDADAGGDRIDTVLATPLTSGRWSHPQSHLGTDSGDTFRAASGTGAWDDRAVDDRAVDDQAVDDQAGGPLSASPAMGLVPDVGATVHSVTALGTARSAHDAGSTSAAAADLAAVRAAKEAVWAGGPVLLPGSGGRPAVLVTIEQVQSAATLVLPAAVSLVTQAIRAADVSPETGTGLILVGGTACIPGIGDLFTSGTGLPAHTPARPELAAVSAAALTSAGAPTGGAGQATGRRRPLRLGRPRDPLTAHAAPTTGETGAAPATQHVRAAVVTWPRRTAARLATLRLWLGPVLLTTASVLLLAQSLWSAWDFVAVTTQRVVIMNAGALLMAAVCAVITAAASAAVFGPTLFLAPAAATPGVKATLERRAVAAALRAAAVLGAGVAAAYGVIAAITYDSPSYAVWFFPLVVCWTVGPALPVAVGIATSATAIRRGAPTPAAGWAIALTMPYRSAALGPAGMMTMGWAMSNPYPDEPKLSALILQGGAAAIGVATACLLADRLILQAVAAVPVTGACLFVGTIGQGAFAGVLAVGWVAAVIVWWTRRAWQLGMSRPASRAAHTAPAHHWSGSR